jgi:CDP-paratose 2-epimerase
VRDVLFVEDMLTLLDAQMSQLSSLRGEVFNVGGGASNAISLREATSAMQEISSRSTSVSQSDKVRLGDVVLYFTDNRRVSQQFGWEPRTDLRAGFTRIFEWIRQNELELRTVYAPSA